MNSQKWTAGGWAAGVLTGAIAIIAACSSDPVVQPPAEAGVNCGDGSQVCGTSCTAIARDAENCGACGKKCGAGEVCSQGACAASCGGGTTKCGTSCVDTKSDGSNCGGCGTKCGATEVCNAGKCASACGAGSTTCGSSCVNTQTDQVNCGSCGTLCKGGEQCVAGKCQLSCQIGLTLCTPPQVDGGVSDAASDAIADSSSEASSDASSDGAIVDASSDAGPVLGTTYCANLQTDNANCGGCGTKCANGQQCVNGSCSTTCGPPNTLCTSDAGPPVCSNLQSDPKNCGGCGTTCPNGTPACVNGKCVPLAPCFNNPKWTPVTCSTTQWVWSSDRVNASNVTAANAQHVLWTGCSHGGVGNTCSLTGQGFVSTQVTTMSGCNTSWYHLGGSFTGNCGGHDGDQVRRLALGPNDCYEY